MDHSGGNPVEDYDIYSELDYRQVLKRRIQRSPKLSLGVVAQRAGCLSKSYLSLMINGKRTLSSEKAALIGRAVGLRGNELKYFESLVRYNGTRDPAAKKHFFKELALLRPQKVRVRGSFDSEEALASWHAMAVRELVSLPNFKPDPRHISILLKGLISPSEASRAFNLLLQTGLVVRSGEGFEAREAAIQTTDERRSLAIRKYHKSCLDLGRRIVDTQPLSDREFGSVNISISREAFEIVKTRLKELRQEIMDLALNDPAPDRVCQLNFQFFHLSLGASHD